ncbi:MAG TPA: hypothetical protein VM431_00820 [Phycisphaerae bacterium]|nr:hypothetical protein [Phycisphaerae bacterium]
MNVADLQILQSVRETLAAAPGLRTVRLVRTKEVPEVPLSRLPAAILEPCGVESLRWPDVPVGRYHLVHWRVSVLDRAVPGTRAFEALVSVAQACRYAVAANPLLGGRAQDGPPSERDAAPEPAVGAMRLGAIRLDETVAGRPTALVFDGASGYWAEPMVGAAALDDEVLFSSGPHAVTVGSPTRRTKDQPFNGLSGGLTLDLGDGSREIRQKGILSAASATSLALLEAAVEAFIDGRTYILTTPDGVDYPMCRLERFDRLGPPRVGTGWHQPYEITYRQLAR